jgi:signal transduction histidine kinase
MATESMPFTAMAEQPVQDLVQTQASLRRLAMLVARGTPSEEVFAAVTKEALGHFGDGTARMIRFEFDGTATLLANRGAAGPHVRVGDRWEGFPPTGLTATVRRTGRTARVDTYRDVPGGDPYPQEGLESAVGIPIFVHGRLWGMMAIGSGSASLPADTEERMADFTDLISTSVANAQSLAELMAARTRLVTAADEVRRRLERQLHDGAQQRLIALALRLRALSDLPEECGDLRLEIAASADQMLDVIDNLREIARGLHPAILSQAGLGPALRTLGRQSAVPTKIDVRFDRRLPDRVEVGAYYVVSELLANAAKHAAASFVLVQATMSGDDLSIHVDDDGVGGADPARGSGLIGLKDRVEALRGTFVVQSPHGSGTTVLCTIPTNLDLGALFSFADADLSR